MLHTVIYVPLYNALIFFTSMFGGSLGFAVIALTFVVKVILSPLSHQSIKNQMEQKKLQPLIAEIKKKYPDQKDQSAQMIQLYKDHKTSPLAGCLLILLQLPIIIALYKVFLAGAVVNPLELYGFVTAPEVVRETFLGLSMVSKSVVLGILAGVTQFLQMHLSPAMQKDPHTPTDDSKEGAMAAMLTKSMKYTMPIMIAVFALAVPGAVALYWVASNIFMIAQERFVMMRQRKIRLFF